MYDEVVDMDFHSPTMRHNEVTGKGQPREVMRVAHTELRAELDMFLDDAQCFLLSQADTSSVETFVCVSVHVVDAALAQAVS